MNEYENYTEYKDERQNIPWKRIILILLSLIVIFVIILLLLRACTGNKNRDNDLLQAGKDYYTDNYNLLPTAPGECRVVTLNQLKDANLIKNTKKYENCDGEATYVQVCYLENKSYQYTPVLSCTDYKSQFGLWTDGKESDLITDSSDVRFTFLGEELNKGIKYYYPSNKTNPEEVSEYYVTAPNDEYINKDSETDEAYKWYVVTSGYTYWNNGAYSATQPNGFPLKGESTTVTKASETNPGTTTYRTVTDATIYRTRKIAYPFKFVCADPITGEHAALLSDTLCERRNTDRFTDTIDMKYTCDGVNEVNKVDGVDYACGNFTEWTTNKCERNADSLLAGIGCESKAGYVYTETMWKWYRNNEGGRSYYPSGAATADGENTYYVTAPTANAIKDEGTKATAHKYYKVEKDETGAANAVEEWVPVTDGYVSESELIAKFKELNYEVDSLHDIFLNDNIRYQVKLQYRNKIAE